VVFQRVIRRQWNLENKIILFLIVLCYRILVGAPLGQNLQPETNRSGALFKCPITGSETDCQQVVTDGKRGQYPFI